MDNTLTKLNIPKILNVGFQARGGTYTGKLAFVTYTDAKGVLRKEKSWNGWRDKKIEAKQFDNVPTSGFVLNKKVGDYSSRWGGRKAWARIYDSRDFEFEISVENLLFILEECTSVKGKGLEGEFVYSWDGQDLVLLPVTSQEYVESTKHTEIQTFKVDKSEIKEGCVYLTKDQKEVLYLGRHDFYEHKNTYTGKIHKVSLAKNRVHVFINNDGTAHKKNWYQSQPYWTQKDFSKIASRINDTISPLYADAFEKFKQSKYSTPTKEVVSKPVKFKEDFYGFIKIGEHYHNAHVYKYTGLWNDKNHGTKIRVSEKPMVITKDTITYPDNTDIYGYSYQNKDSYITEEQLENLCLLYFKTENGNLINMNGEDV